MTNRVTVQPTNRVGLFTDELIYYGGQNTFCKLANWLYDY